MHNKPATPGKQQPQPQDEPQKQKAKAKAKVKVKAKAKAKKQKGTQGAAVDIEADEALEQYEEGEY